jgi:hypothetical protein
MSAVKKGARLRPLQHDVDNSITARAAAMNVL